MPDQPQMVDHQPPVSPDQQPSAAPPGDEMFDGYCDSGGSCLSFSPLDDSSTMDISGYSTLDAQTVALDVGNDGYQNKNQKTAEMDNAYEKMMSERGKIV